MSDILPFLKSMLSTSGLSGRESPVAAQILEKWTPLVDGISQSRLGSIHGLKRGSGRSPRPSLMIATHMDSVGLIVSRIVDGFLYISDIGGIDPRILPGTPVTVHATKGGGELFGAVVLPPSNLLPEVKSGESIPIKHLIVDLGLTPREVNQRVNIGDPVSFGTAPAELSAGFLTGHALDNRASVAALTLCLEELQTRSHSWDVWAVAPVQEEITFAGAYTSAFQLRPDLAVALDMTYGKGSGAGDRSEFPLGAGVTLGVGPSIHPFLHRRFREIAERAGIPAADEPMPSESLTDADAMQLTSEGIPTMVISIPLRNMHTAVEVVALKDVQRAGRLLAEFSASLEADFLENLTWD